MTIIENQKSLNAKEIQKIRHNLANVTLALECSIEN